jgi:hypothetical protein
MGCTIKSARPTVLWHRVNRHTKKSDKQGDVLAFIGLSSHDLEIDYRIGVIPH